MFLSSSERADDKHEGDNESGDDGPGYDQTNMTLADRPLRRVRLVIAVLPIHACRQLGGVHARTQRTLPDQALDCVDHKHGPNRKLDQIPVENPVSITGGSGSYPHR